MMFIHLLIQIDGICLASSQNQLADIYLFFITTETTD